MADYVNQHNVLHKSHVLYYKKKNTTQELSLVLCDKPEEAGGGGKEAQGKD